MSERIRGFAGCDLAIHRIGPAGGGARKVLLLHGLFSSAQMNWIRFGHAQELADAGFEAIMPDARAHGASDAPHDPAAYPPDVLVTDVLALVEALELSDYDLAGFSLGARTAAAAVIAGLRPRRLILAGMGLESLDNWSARAPFFFDAIDRFDEIEQGDAAYLAVQFMKTMKVDLVAARLLLESIGDIDRADIRLIDMPTLVVAGAKDRDNGSPEALARALRDAQFREVPGTHMSSVTEAALGEEMAAFLSS